MALILKDRVRETTSTTGTVAYVLAGAIPGFQSFSQIGNGNTTYYAVTNNVDWEVGLGTYTSAGSTLSRDTILESSNGGAAVNWPAGRKDIFVTYPAERAITGTSSQLEIPNPSTSGNLLTSNGSVWNSSTHLGWVHENTISPAATSVSAILTKAGNQPLTFTNETYAVVVRDVVPQSAAVSLLLRVSTNAGGTINTSSVYRSGYDYGYTSSLPTTTVTQITLSPATITTSGKANGVLYFSYDSGLSRINMTGSISYYDASSSGYTTTGLVSGNYNSASFYGLAFYLSSTNIAGSFDLYKLVRA